MFLRGIGAEGDADCDAAGDEGEALDDECDADDHEGEAADEGEVDDSSLPLGRYAAQAWGHCVYAQYMLDVSDAYREVERASAREGFSKGQGKDKGKGKGKRKGKPTPHGVVEDVRRAKKRDKRMQRGPRNARQ